MKNRNILQFIKKPIVVEAVQFTGENHGECLKFCESIIIDYYGSITIPTLEGNITCTKGDWIIKGIAGEFYPIKADIFKKTYDKVLD
jgi:hypothetical protein